MKWKEEFEEGLSSRSRALISWNRLKQAVNALKTLLEKMLLAQLPLLLHLFLWGGF